MKIKNRFSWNNCPHCWSIPSSIYQLIYVVEKNLKSSQKKNLSRNNSWLANSSAFWDNWGLVEISVSFVTSLLYLISYTSCSFGKHLSSIYSVFIAYILSSFIACCNSSNYHNFDGRLVVKYFELFVNYLFPCYLGKGFRLVQYF